MIRIENLKKDFGNLTVFHDLNMQINDGEVVAFIGPSGSGKSTFLRSIMLLEKPTEGHVYLDETEITGPSKDMGMVFQTFNLFKHLSVVENVMSGMVHLNNISPEESFKKAMELLREVSLADKAYSYTDTLSGGQKQRVAIARALSMNPKVILMDEPTSSLDPLARGEVVSVIRMLASKGHTMVIATNEMELVREICTRVIVFKDGKIIEDGNPEQVFEHPEQIETKRFIHALSVLEFKMESKTFDFIGMQTIINEFAYVNGIPNELLFRLTAIMEELSQMVIIQPKTENKMKISFEYNRKTSSLDGIVEFTGNKLDPDDPIYFFSWPIIVKRASEVEVEYNENEECKNKIKIVIRK